MDAKVRVLASGSSGNALYVGIGDVKLLIDVGIDMALIAARLAEIGEDAAALSTVLITHEHGDHVRGLPQLRKRYPDLTVHATRGTARALAHDAGMSVDDPTLLGGAALYVGPVRVTPFDVSHDAAEPVGFRIDCGDFALGVVTDLGRITADVVIALTGCRMVVLEANHDEDMLWGGPYPEYLKRRIASGRGHLSNRQAAEFLASIIGPDLEYVALAHLSQQNNDPERALAEVISSLAPDTRARVTAAHRTKPSDPVTFRVAQRPLATLTLPTRPTQLSLFD